MPASLPNISYPLDLPVSQRRDEIACAIEANQVLILCGETGSGKTTQLPKICLELGRGADGRMIGHTQPRRLAARSVAARIAQELATHPGEVVGYKIRFGDCTSRDTRVKLMTDGILLAEIQHDPDLRRYDTLIIDEAHERSLNIDFLLGYLKQLLPRRPDLKVIITSATIDPKQFSRHFNDAPIIGVSGRTYPVEVRYRPPVVENLEDEDPDPVDPILSAVEELWTQDARRGDILIFLPGERDIRETADALSRSRLSADSNIDILPLYARLGTDEQMRIFAPHTRPRIVLATNIAETSLTVPGIKYVIDTGLARLSRYSPRSRVQRLPIERISQASSNQRGGRCGRISEGVCIRLYSEEDFNSRPAFTEPEILRTHLAGVLLQMKALGLGDIHAFPFIDPPDYRQIKGGLQTLHELGAVDEKNELTPLGRCLARLAIDPRLGRMILEAAREKCLDEVLIIVTALSIQDPRLRPLDHQQAADAAHVKFQDKRSDFLSFLKLWKFFREREKQLSHGQMRKLCRENFLSFLRMREWEDVHRQLRALAFEALPRGQRPRRHRHQRVQRGRSHHA